MTEEEYFRKYYPDSCYGDKPLSPYWDFFQDGVEFGERQSEKKIEELGKESANLKSTAEFQQSSNMKRHFEIQKLKKENAELKSKKGCETCTKFDEVKLTKAKEIIMNLRNIITSDITIIDTEEKGLFFKQAVEFLKEIEK